MRARSVGVQVAPRTPISRPHSSMAGRRAVYAVGGFRFPVRSPSGCSSVSRAPASGAGGRRSKACRPAQFVVAPLAQLAERSAYTRRELRTGARLEVRILQGVPTSTSRSSADPERGSPTAEVPCSNHGATTEGSAEWSATGPENQGDRKVRGSIPQPSASSRDQQSGTRYQKSLEFQPDPDA